MTTFDEIYDRTLLEKYGSDGEYIAIHQMDSDFQRLFMFNIVRECLVIVNRHEYSYHEADPLWETAQLIKEHFGVE